MCLKSSKKISKNKFLAKFLLAAGFFLAVNSGTVLAQEAKVDYEGAPVVDSDFDGLTDQGETQIYKTDPNNQDTDGDGFYDGSEVLRGTDPLGTADPLDFQLADQIKRGLIAETPWAWYVVRSAGILGFAFLWFSILLGLSVRNAWLKKIIEPVYSLEFHCFLGSSALFWAFIHGIAIVFDKFFGMEILDVIVPFRFQYANFISGGIDYLALGIIAFYAMIVMVFTSYARKIISRKVWRVLHFLNPLAFVFVVFHGYFIGTDLKNIYARSVFVGASALLAIVYLSNLFFVLRNKWKFRNINQEGGLIQQNEIED